MNEDLQQALAELLTMVKSGLSSLPPFLAQLTTELAQYQFMSGLSWALGWGVIAIGLVVVIYWFIRKEIKDKTDEGFLG